MTLEELELRVRAAFPGCKFTPDEDDDDDFQAAEVGFAAAEEILGVVVWGFVAIVSDDPLQIDDVDGDFGCRDDSDVVSEIERCILSVSAHALIAARRLQLSGACA